MQDLMEAGLCTTDWFMDEMDNIYNHTSCKGQLLENINCKNTVDPLTDASIPG